MPPKKEGGGKATDKKWKKYELDTYAAAYPCDKQIKDYCSKYTKLCNDRGIEPVGSYVRLLKAEEEEWRPEGATAAPPKTKGANGGRVVAMRPAVGEKAKVGGDYPPNFPIIFNGCEEAGNFARTNFVTTERDQVSGTFGKDKLSYAQTRVFIDSLAYWPRTWRGSDTWGGMNLIGFWKCWTWQRDHEICNGDDGCMLMMEFLKHDSLEPPDLRDMQHERFRDTPLSADCGGRYACNLKNLEIIGCGVTAEGCRHLGRALTQNETLKYLNLSHNGIVSEGKTVLCPGIGDDGVEALGEGLKWNSSLEILKLEYCSIGWKGGEYIGKYIVRASSVKQLYLKGNNIGAKGVQGISGALAKNMTLQRLDLSDNCFGIHLDAIEALRDGIETNDSLTAVDINLNSLVPAGATMLLEVLKCKPNIKEFSIFERVQDELFGQINEQILLHQKAGKGKKKKGGKKK